MSKTFIVTGTWTVVAKDEDTAREIVGYTQPDDLDFQVIGEDDEED